MCPFVQHREIAKKWCSTNVTQLALIPFHIPVQYNITSYEYESLLNVS